MGVEQINLDEILVRTRPFGGELHEGIWEKLDPVKGAVVVERNFGEEGTYYCVVMGDMYVVRDHKAGKKISNVYVLPENEQFRDAALFAFGNSESNGGPKPKDLVIPIINTMEAPYEDFRKINKLF